MLKKTIFTILLITSASVTWSQQNATVLSPDREKLLSDAEMLEEAYQEFNRNNSMSLTEKSNSRFQSWLNILLEEEYIEEIPRYQPRRNVLWQLDEQYGYIILPSISEQACNDTSFQLRINSTDSNDEVMRNIRNQSNPDICLYFNNPNNNQTIYIYSKKI